jgi:lipopolysaccharide heptosyltransferase II
VNILQILPELRVGGVETGTVDLARHLVKLGHKAVVISAGGELVKELEAAGVSHYQLPVHKKSFFTMLKMIPAIASIIIKENIDIVHARSRVPAWSAYFASRRTGKVFITTCHGFYNKQPFSYVMGWGRKVIAPSNVIARHMIDDFGVPHERISLVPRSVDLSRFRYTNPDEKRKEEFNVGIIGRVTPIKGHLHFIKAMHKASKSIPRLKIWIVGDAPSSKEAYKEQLQVLIKRLGLWHNTEFLGTQRDIPAILTHLDLLVMATTTQEAFGRVVIEAQAAGVPVVATKVGGVIDVIEDGRTGLLVPAADPQSMSEAVVKIFKDKSLARRLAEEAVKNVGEKYNLDLMVKNTLKVYEGALKNHKIMVIKFSSAGDVILSTAAIRAIREKFNHSYKISFLTGEGSKDVLLRCPYIDELLVCDLKNKDKGFKGLIKWGAILRKKDFDIVIDLQNNRKSHILAALSLALDRYGYDNKKFGFLLNHRIRDDKPLISPLEHQFKILKMLGIESQDHQLELWQSGDDMSYIEELLGAEWLSANSKLVGINISASPRWLTKNLTLAQLEKLCAGLGGKDMRIVLTGIEKDSATAEILANALKNIKLINLCGKTTINQLACLIKKCSVYISSDSAPMHIASAVRSPFVALFGPTDPRRHLPPAKNFVMIRKDLACSPCYKPKCKTNECMKTIAVDEILEAVDKLLK